MQKESVSHLFNTVLGSIFLIYLNKQKKIHKVEYDWLVYDDMVQMTNIQLIKRCTLASSIIVALFAGSIKSKMDADNQANSLTKSLKIDSWINFVLDPAVRNIANLFR